MPSFNRFLRSGLAAGSLVLLCGGLTWLGVGWLGNQPLPTAIIAVVLVELLLASIGVIAILLTERMSVSLLNWEKRPPRVKPLAAKRQPVWVRLSDAPADQHDDAPLADSSGWSPTLRFPDPNTSDGHRELTRGRPAA